MSQKLPQNSKRRPPGDAGPPPTDQQDADWGFDSVEAHPGVEKKLAVALVVCLLAGFGFVFYQKLRILRSDGGSLAASAASTPQIAHQSPEGKDAPAADSSLKPAEAPKERPATGTPDGIQSPFYEASTAHTSPKRAVEESWTLTQAEVPAAPASGSPADLLPLPDDASDTGFDPFGGTEPVEAARSTPAGATTPPTEASTFDWEEPPAPAAAPPTQQREHSLPPSASEPQASPDDPLALNPVESAQTEPQTLIFGEAPEPSQQMAEETPPTAFESLPAQSEPQPAAAAPGRETPVGGSTFDPFSGEEPEANAGGATATTAADATSSDTFDPFGAAEASAAAPTEPSLDAPQENSGPSPPVDHPSPFQSPAATESAQTAPAATAPVETTVSPAEPALDLFPVAKPSASSSTQSAPVWPGSDALPAPETNQTPVPVPTGEQLDASRAAPRLLVEPQELEPQPAAVQPAPALPAAGQEPTPPNPFSIDSGPSRPLSGPIDGAQRVIGEREVTVTPSDSFWSISEREYGSSRYFTALARYNQDRVSKPEQLQSGMKIVIPPPEVLEDRFPELLKRPASGTPTIAPMSGSSASLPTGPFRDDMDRPMYRVGERDTLSTIAQVHLGRSSRWTELYELNRDRLKSPSTLAIGMELRLPPDASGVRVSPAGGFDR